MKPKTLLVLAAVVALLGAFIWFFERDLPGSDEREAQAKKVLGGLESADVEAIDIAWDDGDRSVRLEKTRPEVKDESGEGEDSDAEDSDAEDSEDGDADTDFPESTDFAEPTWRLVEPRDARADPAEVRSLLSALTSLEKNRTVEDADRSAVGLDPPEVTVTLVTEDGDRVLELGAKVPVSDDRFVALGGGSEVFLTADSVYDDLVQEPIDWLDRQIVGADRDDVTRIEMRVEPAAAQPDDSQEATPDGTANRTVILAREGEGFRLEAPFRDRADREKARALVGRLVDLRAQRFVEVPEDPPAGEGEADFGLDPPVVTLTATLGGAGGKTDETGGTVRLEIGAVLDEELGRRYGRSGDQVFVFQNRELVDDVLRSAAEWRSPSWSGLPVFQIDSVTVQAREATEGATDATEGAPEGDAEELTVTRSGSDWLRGEDRIPYTTVSDLLYALTDAEATRFLTEDEARAAGWSLDAPTHTLTVRAQGFDEETLTLYPPVEEGVPARASDREAVLLLPAERRTVLEEALAGVRTAEAIPEEEEEDEGTSLDPLEDLEITEEEG